MCDERLDIEKIAKSGALLQTGTFLINLLML
jgi:hypothetical protein